MTTRNKKYVFPKYTELSYAEFSRKTTSVRLADLRQEHIDETTSSKLGAKLVPRLFGQASNTITIGAFNNPARIINTPSVYADEDPEKTNKRSIFIEFPEGHEADMALAIDAKLKELHDHQFEGLWNPSVRTFMEKEFDDAGNVISETPVPGKATAGMNIDITNLMRPTAETYVDEEGIERNKMVSCIRSLDLKYEDPETRKCPKLNDEGLPVWEWGDMSIGDIQKDDKVIITAHMGSLSSDSPYILRSKNTTGNGHKLYVVTISVLVGEREKAASNVVDLDELTPELRALVEARRAAKEKEASKKADDASDTPAGVAGGAGGESAPIPSPKAQKRGRDDDEEDDDPDAKKAREDEAGEDGEDMGDVAVDDEPTYTE